MNLLTALLISIIAPAILALIQNYFRRQEKKMDWEREDAVKKQAEEAARLLLESNERVARTAKETNGKLDVIHGLVNSQMTAAMESELAAYIGQQALMREIMDMKTSKGHKATTAATQALTIIAGKITELKARLGDRKAAADKLAAKGA